MADQDASTSQEQQNANNGDSEDRPILPPVRKLSALAPKPQRGLSLPGLGEISLREALRDPIRRQSLQPIVPPPLYIPGVTVFDLDGLQLQEYLILDKYYTMQKPDNEETSESTRRTVENRDLKYVLSVLQEPQRARACGNGPRASSDRRPVDPPPVVQLKVYDVTEGEKDVTMSYESGFMLYASLEVARPIANGRMQTPPHPPVLTGVAVASAAYLDRPHGPAGYFIFPDLSVRHEGWYRLKFSLFEAVKHHQDADHGRPFPSTDIRPTDTRQPDAHQAMANRMEVSSRPFQVFSAKKFPGLDQSTEVSKALADQGCRVRIRRDIRQRKRVADDKPKSEDSDRTHSMDSQYQDLRQGSMDSHYARPTPSRQLSIASMTQPSPTISAASQIPMGPPMHRPSWETSPVTASYSPAARYGPNWPSLSAVPTSGQTLPPMSMLRPTSNSTYGTRPKYYPEPEAKTGKRTYCPTEYDQASSMKLGARPDAAHDYTWEAPKQGQHIEVGDDDDQEDDESHYGSGYALFKRGHGVGVTGRKPWPGTPRGMDDLLRRDA